MRKEKDVSAKTKWGVGLVWKTVIALFLPLTFFFKELFFSFDSWFYLIGLIVLPLGFIMGIVGFVFLIITYRSEQSRSIELKTKVITKIKWGVFFGLTSVITLLVLPMIFFFLGLFSIDVFNSIIYDLINLIILPLGFICGIIGLVLSIGVFSHEKSVSAKIGITLNLVAILPHIIRTALLAYFLT